MSLPLSVPHSSERPLVSVVIPAYNSARTLAHALDSVLAQTYADIEIIVVDDGSTDSTPEVLHAYRDRVRGVRQPNRGIAAARNTGCRMAKGPLIALMDHDDLCEPERIAVQVAALRAHPGAVLCSSDFSAFDHTGPLHPSHGANYYSRIRNAPHRLHSLYPEAGWVEIPREEWPTRREPPSLPVLFGPAYPEIAFGNFVHPPTVMLRSGALEAAGMFDESLSNNSDWECFVRMARRGPFVHVARSLLAYRLSATQVSSARGNGGKGALDLIRASAKVWDADPGLVAAQSARIRRCRREFCLEAAYALSEQRKMQSAKMLAASLRHGAPGSDTLKVLLRILTPMPLLHLARRVRAKTIEMAMGISLGMEDLPLAGPELLVRLVG